MSDYQAFRVQQQGAVARVVIDRPAKRNAMNEAFWRELPQIFAELDATDSVRVVVLAAAGEHFSSGIDLHMLAELSARLGQDVGRNAELLRRTILELQASLSAVDECRKPVLAAIQGYCLGGAIDLISACDMRYATADAQFAIREIDMGMAADVGTLQRLPRIIGDGMLRELAYTGDTLDGEQARAIGLVNRTYADLETLEREVMALAERIAEKSPLAIRGTKRMIRYMRDHRVDDGLDYVATWNAAMLQAPDLKQAVAAQLSRQKVRFAD